MRASRKRPVVGNADGTTKHWTATTHTPSEVWINGYRNHEPDRRVIMVVRTKEQAEAIIARLRDVFKI